MDVALNYFAATLSQSQEYNVRCHGVQTTQSAHGTLQYNSRYVTLTDFVDYLAREYPNRLAAGSVLKDGSIESLDFAMLKDVTAGLASWFRDQLRAPSNNGGTVALLASSSLVFLVAWLGLSRAGYRVLLVAPQNTPENVRHLIESSKAIAICHDAKRSDLAKSASKADRTGQIVLEWKTIIDVKHNVSELEPLPTKRASDHEQALETVYYFHSTGTTGRPKLIPQTHHGAVGVLPILQDAWPDHGRIGSTFTTTPLYHGGIADLLRSWSAGAALWILSENSMRITGQNVLKCLKSIDEFSSETNTYLANLSCVPYVLEMTMDESVALDRLRRLERVGVGGAAMTRDLGDEAIAAGVKLLSRFGSSECGFLLSSERNFDSCQDWYILRGDGDIDLFECRSDDMYELVLPLSWPAVSTADHARRPFRTKDMFKKYSNGWGYIGRNDTQMTLITGKKFDPTELECMARGINVIEEAMVVGEGKIQPAMLLFLTEKASLSNSNEQGKAAESVMKRINTNVPPHARLKQGMIKILPFTECSRIQRDLKGGIMRKVVLEEFHQEIDALYETRAIAIDHLSGHDEIRKAIMMIVQGQLSYTLAGIDPCQSFYEYGLDSAGYALIYNQLKRSLLSARGATSLSLSVVFEHDTADSLATWIQGYLERRDSNKETKREEQIAEEMNAMYTEYSARIKQREPINIESVTGKEQRIVILTGATGFLGAHILSCLLQDESVIKVYLLVRTSVRTTSHTIAPEQSDEKAWARVRTSLKRRSLFEQGLEEKVRVLAVNFEDDWLGLRDLQYQNLSREVTHLIHAAWDVNFNMPLRRFRPQLRGLVNLLRLLGSDFTTAKKRFVFCSSTAADVVSDSCEDVSNNIPSTGYGQSKLVAERVLQAQDAVELTILRIGQLCGNTLTGVWNRQEAWPLMIDASLRAIPAVTDSKGAQSAATYFPDLASIEQPDIDWLPVDTAARNVLEYSFAEHSGIQFELVANGSHKVSWGRFQDILEQQIFRHNKREVTFITPSAWLDLLEGSSNHPAQSLIPLWRENWNSRSFGHEEQNRRPKDRHDSSSEVHDAEVLNDGVLARIVDWTLAQK